MIIQSIKYSRIAVDSLSQNSHLFILDTSRQLHLRYMTFNQINLPMYLASQSHCWGWRRSICYLRQQQKGNLTQNTEAVCTTFMKVCTFLLFVFFFCAHLCCCSRFANSPSPLSIPPPLPFLHGLKPMPLTPYLYSLSLVMLKLNGILHTICWT